MPIKRYRLAQQRRAVGYSQESFAERVGVDRSTVARWESGETEPQPWQRRNIARALQVSLSQLDTLLQVPVPSPGSERLEFALTHPGMVDLAAVGVLRERVRQLSGDYDLVPSSSLLGAAGQCYGQVLFLRGHAPGGRVRRELCAAEAESATLLGQLVWDASQRRDHNTATGYFDAAIGAAAQIHDLAAQAHARLRKSFVALYGLRDPAAGLELAHRAASAAQGISRVLAGLGLLHVAEAHAMAGQRRDCEHALGVAQAHFERIVADDLALDLFTPVQFDRLAGSCYLFLGIPGRAQPLLERAAQCLPGGHKSRAIVLGNLALAQIRRGQSEEGAATLHGAFDVLELTRGGGGMSVAVTVVRELRPVRHQPWVQDLNDRFIELMAV